MHLQQVWTIRHNWKIWWPLYPLTQHHKWKGWHLYFPSYLIFSILSDLCSAMVLVCVSVHCFCHPTHLENIIHNIKKDERVHPQEADTWVCSGKTATKCSLYNYYPPPARACCHLLCQAEHGRLEYGSQPDGVHSTQGSNVAKSRGPDASEVSKAVRVRIKQEVRIDLVDWCSLPPFLSLPRFNPHGERN